MRRRRERPKRNASPMKKLKHNESRMRRSVLPKRRKSASPRRPKKHDLLKRHV